MTSSTADKYTTTEYGKQNRFAVNPQPWIDEADKDYDNRQLTLFDKEALDGK